MVFTFQENDQNIVVHERQYLNNFISPAFIGSVIFTLLETKWIIRIA